MKGCQSEKAGSRPEWAYGGHGSVLRVVFRAADRAARSAAEVRDPAVSVEPAACRGYFAPRCHTLTAFPSATAMALPSGEKARAAA